MERWGMENGFNGKQGMDRDEMDCASSII